MQRSNLEERSRLLLPWISVAAVAMLAVGVLLLIPESGIVVSFAGLFAVILGSALLTPLLTSMLMSGAQRHDEPVFRHHRSHGAALCHAFAQSNFGRRRCAHGLGQRNHRRWHHDQQFPRHGECLAQRCSAG